MLLFNRCIHLILNPKQLGMVDLSNIECYVHISQCLLSIDASSSFVFLVTVSTAIFI